METNPTYPIDLITLYLAGEAGSDDLVFLEAWLKANPGNRKIFEDYRRTWIEIERVRMDSALDTGKEWNKLEKKIQADKTRGTRHEAQEKGFIHALIDDEQQTTSRFLHVQYRQVMRIAAIILIIVIPSFFIFRNLTRPEQKQLNATLSIKEGKLPDGTSVTLNKGAILEYPSSFKKNKRNVKLNGEAWFEVRHDDAKPFIVTSHNVRVEVLGTSFYVNTNAANNTMEVILNSGSVAIYFDDHKENSLFLSPGEKAEIIPGQEKMVKDINTDQNYRAWMTQRFIFNNTPLVTIVADLNKVYHANLRIATPVSYCLVTATFDHQSVESILHVLQATLDLTISTHRTWTDISGNKCN
jgi:ferric-dicitrate binding protein FerR (iron transport regulator)